MKYQAPGAPVTTRLDFSRGDARAAAVHVVIEFEPSNAPPYPESRVKAMLADRYANGGTRYTRGKFPAKGQGGLFDTASSVTVFEQLPPTAPRPDYPSPAAGG